MSAGFVTGLTPRDVQALADLALACAQARGSAQLIGLAPMLKQLIPHRRCVLAVVGMNGCQQRVFSVAHSRTIACRDSMDSAQLAHWMVSLQPWVTPESGSPLIDAQPEPERSAGHGVLDAGAVSASYAEMSGVPTNWPDDWLLLRLHLIMPHLHQAIASVRRFEGARPEGAARLTEVERELLNCLAAGQSNKEIARARARSEATVRNQLHTLFRKLQVRNRAQAVWIALPWNTHPMAARSPKVHY